MALSSSSRKKIYKEPACKIMAQPPFRVSSRGAATPYMGMTSSRIQLCAMALLWLATPGAAHAEPCGSKAFKGASYILCSFDVAKDDLRIYWRGDNGQPYRTFAALAADLEAKGKSLRFAMNGGMYQGDLRPVGLYIENGRELTPANIATLTGAS
jgi:uncharacterized protein YigE (DUF2233 family)